ncbi:DUF3859 domain-containing protein [Pararhodobacter zhoushanensis]|uniref:DUF3859 domain-containing protein n=1 Tax=Pararhodobacter zhoushanensis TaxID=2479545 RepID=A0ABT3H4J2_9RHOB|nr:DUF3859 domain-containing protein [Pararhodobacter zhoushanensis]MCW1934714.1 DUF3859 domain-containing protein [Pararhodobacter zhoushanensis]
MARSLNALAGPALVAGLCLFGAMAVAQPMGPVSPRVQALTAGLFCAPPEGDRRPAPDTLAGWVHVPDSPVEMVAQGNAAPAVIGLGFGVRYALSDPSLAPGMVLPTHYTVTHPPMPPSAATSQSWTGSLVVGTIDTVFFQFDTTEELQPGEWTFTAEAGGEVLFSVLFTVTTPAELPALAQICQGDALMSLLSQRSPGATG